MMIQPCPFEIDPIKTSRRPWHSPTSQNSARGNLGPFSHTPFKIILKVAPFGTGTIEFVEIRNLTRFTDPIYFNLHNQTFVCLLAGTDPIED